MMNPALPRTQVDENGQPLSDIEPLRCVGCETAIFNSARSIEVRGKLWCSEGCADRTAIRRLRSVGRALPY